MEKWLKARTAATEVTHLVHAPSNPPGWTAGKWGEWYPDVLDADGKLTVAKPKPYWQSGWLKQHDRLMEAMTGNERAACRLMISGDMHAIAIGRMLRSGSLDLTANPVNAVLSGPIGTRPAGWPSQRRGIGAQPSVHLDLAEEVKPIEQHNCPRCFWKARRLPCTRRRSEGVSMERVISAPPQRRMGMEISRGRTSLLQGMPAFQSRTM